MCVINAGCLEAVSALLISPQGFLFSFFIYAVLRTCSTVCIQIPRFICQWECRRWEFGVCLLVDADLFGGFKSGM